MADCIQYEFTLIKSYVFRETITLIFFLSCTSKPAEKWSINTLFQLLSMKAVMIMLRMGKIYLKLFINLKRVSCLGKSTRIQKL